MTKTIPNFSDNAKTVLLKRYLQPGETPEQMLERVSLGNPEYYELMARLDFLPNSPTLFNCGTGNGGCFSACFKFDVPDSMDGIMDTAKKAARVQKAGGGVGYSFSLLRPRGALVKGTGNHAGGPVIFMKMYNAMGDAVTQSGKRAAAQMGILHVDHPDVQEFIHSKDVDPDSLSTFNISVAATNDFMDKAITEPESKQGQLLDEISMSAWKTGDPGFYFIDIAEATNPTPHLGKLTGTNPCGEVPLLDNEPCNLGSINLRNFIKDKDFDWARLETAVRTATRFLDDILEANNFPDPEISNAAYTTRKLGLGVMGWADVLALLNIPYASDEAVYLAEELMAFIQAVGNEESTVLGIEKGYYPGWKEGCPERRNATVTCIAPTGTISLLAGVSSGIEPHFRLKWTREMGDGTILNEEADVLKECGGFIPATADEIGYEWHVKHQAAFQKHTDLAVSKTINLPNSATWQDIKKAYILMWQLGCKGGTVFRDGCREQQVLRDVEPVLVPTITTAPVEKRKKLPTDRKSVTHKFTVGGEEGYLIVGLYDDGSPGEMFIKHKEGTTISGLLDGIAILTSLGLQNGVKVEDMERKLQGVRFEPSGMTGNKDIPVATSIVDYIFRWLGKKWGNGKSTVNSGMICSMCYSSAILSGGCITCTNPECGYSKCG